MLAGGSAPTLDAPDAAPPAPGPPGSPVEPPVESPATSPQQDTGRSKAVAGVTAFHLHLALSRISGRVSTAMSRFVQDMPIHFEVPDGQTSLGVYSDRLRAGMKRRAQHLSRSQHKIYSFLTKCNLPEAAVDELC